MCKARLEAVGRAEPSLFEPGRAELLAGLHRAQSPAWVICRPEPGLEPRLSLDYYPTIRRLP
jgi:hypothetical protein